MTCAEVDDRLDDYVDDTLAEAEFQELELHLAGCAVCREQERRLRSLLAQAAALPRELAPARDLWPGIRARLGRPGVLPFSRSFSGVGSWLPASLAAAAVVALAVAALVRTSGTAYGPSQVSAFPTGSSTEAAGVLKAERDYAQASAALLAALRERPERLSAETLAAIEKDLLVIDGALTQIREALAQDPSSGALNHLLASTHQRKLKVLQRVVKLSRI
jgi:anti-sigma factor RsiW